MSYVITIWRSKTTRDPKSHVVYSVLRTRLKLEDESETVEVGKRVGETHSSPVYISGDPR